MRGSQSFWELVGPEVEAQIVARLAGDLESGAWDAKWGELREQQSCDGSLRLVISEPG